MRACSMVRGQAEEVFGPDIDFREYSFLENPRAAALNDSVLHIQVCKVRACAAIAWGVTAFLLAAVIEWGLLACLHVRAGWGGGLCQWHRRCAHNHRWRAQARAWAQRWPARQSVGGRGVR